RPLPDAAGARRANAQGHGQWAAVKIMDLRRRVADLTERERREVNELQLDHRADSADGQADTEADRARFAERAVSHSFGAELFVQAAIDAERAAVSANVLSEQRQLRLRAHLLGERFIDRLGH